MVTFKNLSRFFARGSGGKYQLDVHEIRARIIAEETAQDRLRHFRVERVTRIVALDTPAPVGDGPKLILHALPVGVSQDAWARFLTMQETQIMNGLQPIGGPPKIGASTLMDLSFTPFPAPVAT